jgi:hypothetical protein
MSVGFHALMKIGFCVTDHHRGQTSPACGFGSSAFSFFSSCHARTPVREAVIINNGAFLNELERPPI